MAGEIGGVSHVVLKPENGMFSQQEPSVGILVGAKQVVDLCQKKNDCSYKQDNVKTQKRAILNPL